MMVLQYAAKIQLEETYERILPINFVSLFHFIHTY